MTENFYPWRSKLDECLGLSMFLTPITGMNYTLKPYPKEKPSKVKIKNRAKNKSARKARRRNR